MSHDSIKIDFMFKPGSFQKIECTFGWMHRYCDDICHSKKCRQGFFIYHLWWTEIPASVAWLCPSVIILYFLPQRSSGSQLDYFPLLPRVGGSTTSWNSVGAGICINQGLDHCTSAQFKSFPGNTSSVHVTKMVGFQCKFQNGCALALGNCHCHFIDSRCQVLFDWNFNYWN